MRWLFCYQCNYPAITLKTFTWLYSGVSVDLPYSSAHNTAVTQAAYTPPCRTLYRSAQPPYYNKVYIRVQRCALVVDPCQTVQQIADRASPAGSASPPVQSQPGGFQSGTGSAVRACRVGLAHSTRRGSPAAGVRRAARNYWRLPPLPFSGFRPIANRGQQ